MKRIIRALSVSNLLLFVVVGAALFFSFQQIIVDTRRWIKIMKLQGTIRINISDLMTCERYPYDPVRFNSSERSRCYSQKLSHLVRTSGIGLAKNTLMSYLEKGEGKYLVGTRCHGYGHDIGSAAVQNGSPGDVILLECRDFCGNGCLNGAAHAYVLLGKTPREMEEFCSASDNISLRRGCFHGIGHGLGTATNGDVTRAVSICNTFKTDEAKYECSHAVFMDEELITGSRGEGIPGDLTPYCHTVADLHQPSCFAFTGFMTFAKTRSAMSAFLACQKVPSAHREQCQRRIGEALVFAFTANPAAMAYECARGSFIESIACLTGTINSIIHSTDSSYGEKSILVCRSLPNREKKECFGILGDVLSQVYDDSVRDSVCNTLMAEEAIWCNYEQ